MTSMAVEAPKLGARGGFEIRKNTMDNRFMLRRFCCYACTVISSVDFDKEMYFFARDAMYLTLAKSAHKISTDTSKT